MTLTLLTICLIIAVVTILVLAIKYHVLGSQINERVRERFQAWEQKERDQIRNQQMEIATREAQVQFEKWKTASEASIREDAIRRSQAVTLGKVTEHLVPFLPDFCYNPKDARFIGSPIDF